MHAPWSASRVVGNQLPFGQWLCCQWQFGRMAQIGLWCCSLKHRHFCAKIPQPPNDLHFLIPLVETLPLVTRIYPIEGFLFTSKLSEKKFQTDPRLVGGYILASTATKKKGWFLFLL
jgi:hypothetical protein